MATSSLTPEDEDFNDLSKASLTGDLDLLKNLVAKRGEEGRIIEPDYCTIALFVAASEGKTNICKYLIEDMNVNPHDISLGNTTLITSLSGRHIDTSIYLVQMGVDPNRRNPISELTPLHYAAREGDISLLELLLAKGVNVNANSPTGTPLIEAISNKKPEAVKVLLDRHADANLSYHHITPVAASIWARSMRCVQLLADAYANLDVAICGMTPLLLAVEINNVEIVKCLLQNKADPNISNEEGQRPIEVAALRRYREVFDALQSCTLRGPKDPEWSFDEMSRHAYSDEAKLFKERKLKGTNAFNGEDYHSAVFWYSMACNDGLKVDCSSRAKVYSNRSLCYSLVNCKEAAIRDAIVCWMLDDTFPKAYYRLGSALTALEKFSAAAYALSLGLKLNLKNSERRELRKAHAEAIKEASIHTKEEDPKSRDVFYRAIAPYMPYTIPSFASG